MLESGVGYLDFRFFAIHGQSPSQKATKSQNRDSNDDFIIIKNGSLLGQSDYQKDHSGQGCKEKEEVEWVFHGYNY